jgi:hypothetical protein
MRKVFEGEDQSLVALKKTGSFLATTPFLLVYLLVIDTFFLIITSVLTLPTMLVSLISCGKISQKRVEEFIDSMFMNLFGMQKMDIVGFRRLRTSS